MSGRLASQTRPVEQVIPLGAGDEKNLGPCERLTSRFTRQILARNHRSLCRKNFPRAARHRLAHILSLIGILLHPLLRGDLAGPWGTLEDLRSSRRRAA